MISNIMRLRTIFEKLGPIEKKIHISWKAKDILELEFSIVKHGIRAMKDLNPEYELTISDNDDVETYIKKNISEDDYKLIKDRTIVEKTDLWRLLKIYNEGGVYMDIDRLCNIPIRAIVNDKTKCVLAMHYDIDFAQDIMISCSNNIFHKRAIELNLERRRQGCTDILSLGPITYFHAITEIMLGKQSARWPDAATLCSLREIIDKCEFLETYREDPPYNTLLYRGPAVSMDKTDFYKHCDVKHWGEYATNSPTNKPYGQ